MHKEYDTRPAARWIAVMITEMYFDVTAWRSRSRAIRRRVALFPPSFGVAMFPTHSKVAQLSYQCLVNGPIWDGMQ